MSRAAIAPARMSLRTVRLLSSAVQLQFCRRISRIPPHA